MFEVINSDNNEDDQDLFPNFRKSQMEDFKKAVGKSITEVVDSRLNYENYDSNQLSI